MITEDYVSFETAKLLKEKGFDEPCDFVYDGDKLEWIHHKFIFLDGKISTNSTFNFDGIISAPTIQMAMKWIRMNHNIHIIIESGKSNKVVYFSNLKDLHTNNFVYNDTKYYETCEQACEAAIKYCLENLI